MPSFSYKAKYDDPQYYRAFSIALCFSFVFNADFGYANLLTTQSTLKMQKGNGNSPHAPLLVSLGLQNPCVSTSGRQYYFLDYGNYEALKRGRNKIIERNAV